MFRFKEVAFWVFFRLFNRKGLVCVILLVVFLNFWFMFGFILLALLGFRFIVIGRGLKTDTGMGIAVIPRLSRCLPR